MCGAVDRWCFIFRGHLKISGLKLRCSVLLAANSKSATSSRSGLVLSEGIADI
jgi:hypothetical protein